MPQVLKYFSAPRVFEDIKGLYGHVRWCTGEQIFQAGEYIASRLKTIPQLKVELAELPADGRSMSAGWVMPKAWDVKQARLSIVSPVSGDGILADYRQNPHSLMMWSAPTPEGPIEAEVVRIKNHAQFKGSLRGKFAFVENLPQGATAVLAWAAQNGAAGLLTDHVIRVPKVKDGPYLDKAVHYFNYTNPPWDGERRLPAFALTPERGRVLRALLDKGRPVRLRAVVESTLYDGKYPLVLAALPGETNDEIVLTGHMDEPGASDNCSGAALAMEVLRALAAYTAARGRKLCRTVRILLSGEVRGLQYYLNSKKYGRRVIAGLDLDMLGYEPRAGRTSLQICSVQPQAPSGLEALLENLIQAEAARPPRFKWRLERHPNVNDCHFSSLPCHTPMCALEQAPDRTYHTSLDVPENLSAAHLKRMGGIITRAVLFLADPKFSDTRRLARVIFRNTARRLQVLRSRPRLAQPRESAERLIGGAKRMWADVIALLPVAPWCPSLDAVKKLRRERKFVRGYLYPSVALQEETEKLEAELKRLAAGVQAAPEQTPAVDARTWREAQNTVPLKKFVGYLGFEDLGPAGRRELLKQTGIAAGWSAPGWLQWALDLSNGKRTVAEIVQQMSACGAKPPVKSLLAALRFLSRTGKVNFRPILAKADLLAALRRAGIQAGDVVMAHTSLSEFGYFAGGVEALIEGLLAAVGPKGTLCMPTHSLSRIGCRPYDPQTSVSTVGTVTNVFLKRPGVLRSAHPTHSCAAFGPRARELVAGHDAKCAPQGREGFWGNLVRADGKILMLCQPGANTLLHAADLWAGVPYPSRPAHFMRDGKRVETVVPGMPWHTNSFKAIYAKMNARKLIREVKFGESTLYTMRARDAVAVGMSIMRRKPLLATQEGCNCAYCLEVRAAVARRKRQ